MIIICELLSTVLRVQTVFQEHGLNREGTVEMTPGATGQIVLTIVAPLSDEQRTAIVEAVAPIYGATIHPLRDRSA